MDTISKRQGRKFIAWITKHLALFIMVNEAWIVIALVLFLMFVSIFGAMDIIATDTNSDNTIEVGALYKSSPLQPPYVVTEEFGRYSGNASSYGFHYGTDLSAYYGASVYSVLSGTVLAINNTCSSVSWSCGGEYGNYVYMAYTISDTQTLYVMYGHLDSVRVAIGQQIEKGTMIGLQGNSGKSTGTHLHFEVRSENSPDYKYRVNPRKYFEF